jgi:hypothetical protein
MDPNPKPFEISAYPPNDPHSYWAYWMKVGPDERVPAEHERRALLMRHAPELLHELRACYEILLRVLDHHRDGVPLPPQFATRRTCQEALNVIGLAEGKIVEGTWRYPPPEDS